jgi:hypothetical protein
MSSTTSARPGPLVADYLVIGAGAMGMAFVDALIEDDDVEVVMVDRRHGPGGHWLDAYPFVQLHQPSMNYGVSSTPLGRDRVERDGRDAGYYERAAGSEICAYYDDLLRHRFLASGRVRFFPMCDAVGGRRFRSRLTGEVTEVDVRRRVVDATYMASRVPATDPPPFEVAAGVACVPVGELSQVAGPPSGYVVIGGGKTGMDAICWLLDLGTPPDDITWIRSRDSWMSNRAFFQPGDSVVRTFEGVVVQLEAVAECDSTEAVFDRLEAHGVMFRTDPSVQPTMMRGATVSAGELEQLRRVERVVRMGRVRRIDRHQIVLDDGSIPTDPDRLHVHCASAGLSDGPPRPIFTDEVITLQHVTRISLSMSGAMAGFLETTGRPTDDKNRLLPPNPWPHTPFDWLRAILVGMRTEVGWREAPELQAWVDASRLNLMRGLADVGDPTVVRDLQGRFLRALFPALENLDRLAAAATAEERARLVAA